MERFLADSTYAQLAHSLLRTNHVHAGQFGGIAFEQMVRERVPKGTNYDDKDLKAIIDELHNQGIIDALTHGTWQLARRTRNKAIHMNPSPSLPEVKQLIEVLDVSAPGLARTKR